MKRRICRERERERERGEIRREGEEWRGGDGERERGEGEVTRIFHPRVNGRRRVPLPLRKNFSTSPLIPRGCRRRDGRTDG